MKYPEVRGRLEKLRDVPAKTVSFERFKEAVRAFNPPFPKNGVTLIAGTNGKGTVAKTLETLYEAAGFRTGLFTSPHLMETTERIRSGGHDLTQNEFVEAFGRIESFVDRFGLSHFEILTLMMMEVFFCGRVRPPVERAVIEVGVGGRLDPTRLVPHDTSVITWLGLDHQDLLGPTLSHIAREKFGIVDEGNLVVHAPFPTGISAPAGWREAVIHPFRIEAGTWILQAPEGEAPLALRGERAVQNTSIALSVLRAQGLAVRELLPKLAGLSWPCRMERVTVSGRTVFLSGDHNLEGIHSLDEILRALPHRKLRIVFGAGAKKQTDAMLSALAAQKGAEFYLTTTPVKGAPLEAYGETWLSRAKFCNADPVSALRAALSDADQTDLVLVTGSLYLAGSIRKSLTEGVFGTAIFE